MLEMNNETPEHVNMQLFGLGNIGILNDDVEKFAPDVALYSGREWQIWSRHP